MRKSLIILLAINTFVLQAQDLTSLLHQECVVLGKATESSHPTLYKMVQETAHALNMNMPELIYIYNQSEQFNNNAFVYLNLNKVFIGKTLTQTLSYDELKAIIAHELSHLKNNHGLKKIALFVSAITVSTYITYLIYNHIDTAAENLYNWLTTKCDNVDFFASQYQLKGMLVQASMSLTWIPMSIGIFKYIRHTEKEADLAALKATKPSYLANALLKLKENARGMNLMKHLSVYKAKKSIKNIFRTHPSIKERVAYLKEEELKLTQNS